MWMKIIVNISRFFSVFMIVMSLLVVIIVVLVNKLGI